MVPFFIKDCALAVMATGESASSLPELRDIVSRISPSSLYYHFWGSRLRLSFLQIEYLNDFARWAHFNLHDDILAERLEVIDPTDYKDLEELRQILIEIIEQRMDEAELISVHKDMKFYFLRSMIVVFDTPISVSHPSEWKSVLPSLSSSAIFYHFIDARKRNARPIDDFSNWLEESFHAEYKELVLRIQRIDPYFFSLGEIKKNLCELVNQYLP